MTDVKRRDDGIGKLKRLARLYARELRTRDWGRKDYDSLLRESKASREKIDDAERWLTRWSLSAVDRVGSIVVAAAGCVEFASSSNRPIPPRVLRDVLGVLREQAVRATGDTHAAIRAIEWRPDVAKVHLCFAEAVAELGKGLLPVSTSRRKRVPPVVRVLPEVLAATMLVERTVAVVHHIVAREEDARRHLDAAAVADACRFIGKAAGHVRVLLTIALPAAIEGASLRRKNRTKRARVTRGRRAR
jgi:hypothetical protein